MSRLPYPLYDWSVSLRARPFFKVLCKLDYKLKVSTRAERPQAISKCLTNL